MKILNKKILNKAATFLLMAVLLCCNAVQVEAYTVDNALIGYPFVVDNFVMSIQNYDTNIDLPMTLHNQNLYNLKITESYSNINRIYFGNLSSSFVIPYEPDLYDYYVVGTFGAVGSISDTVFEVNSINFFQRYDTSGWNGFWKGCTDFLIFDFLNANFYGKSFSAKLPVLEDTNLSVLSFDFSNCKFSGDFTFCSSIIPIAKGSEVEQLNQSILNELIKINQNLVTSNSLQQSTIDAINNHDANVGNWLSTLTNNLGSWFQQLYTSMGVGFEKLYQQMTKEQEDKLYGYQDTTTSEAASAFSSESDKLTALEGELSTQSNTYVTDYAAEGFDLGVLATIGSSLIFVTTWFTNFWNMGGVFTAALNFCFALSIVFFILRIKR